MRKGDGAKRMLISLADGGRPYVIDPGCYAVVNAKRSDGAYWFGDCVIANNTISCDADGAIATTEGRIDCDVTLFSADGEPITSPRFSIVIYPGVNSSDLEDEGDEYLTLTELVITADETATELIELKNSIAEETEKANEAIKEFNGWYDGAKTELAELTSNTRVITERLTSACAEVIDKTENDTAELIESTEQKCDEAIAGVEQAKEELSSDIKTELAEFSSTGKYITVPASAWQNDAELADTKSVRIGYKANNGATVAIYGQGGVLINQEFNEYTASFNIPEDLEQIMFRFQGGPVASYVQPYDIADVKLFDENGVNVLPEDIADLGWWFDTTADPANKMAVSFEDGLKYIHVWKQVVNSAMLVTYTHIPVKAGSYTMSVRLRTCCDKYTAIVPFDGIRAASSTMVTPAEGSAMTCVNLGVRAFAQRVGEIAFTAETKPEADLRVGVTAISGVGGAILNCAASADQLEIVGSYVGDGSGVITHNVEIQNALRKGGGYIAYGGEVVVDSVVANYREIQFPPNISTIWIYRNETLIATVNTAGGYSRSVAEVSATTILGEEDNGSIIYCTVTTESGAAKTGIPLEILIPAIKYENNTLYVAKHVPHVTKCKVYSGDLFGYYEIINDGGNPDKITDDKLTLISGNALDPGLDEPGVTYWYRAR